MFFEKKGPVWEALRRVEAHTWRYKDWGDVVELIRRNKLPETLADQVHPTVRGAYLRCYDQAQEEDHDQG